MSDQPKPPSGISRRGFASMDPERQREIARMGGAGVPAEKRSFSQDRTLAASAGRKGGEASHGSKKTKADPVPPRPQDDFGIHGLRRF